MKQTKLIQRMFCTVVAAFLLVFGVVTSAPITANAAVVSYDKTNIMDDLQDIDTADYPADENGVPQVLRFQEYCYTEKAFYQDYYGLYIYIYNPTETALNVSGNFNTAQMATDYNAEWEPINYNKIPLTYCTKTDNNRFYKFKVSASNLLLPVAKEYAAAHEGERRYDIAGIELKAADGNKTIRDELHAKTYYFTGYAAGCAADASVEDETSTLACYSEGLDTIELDVQHTYYRTGEYYKPGTEGSSDNIADGSGTGGGGGGARSISGATPSMAQVCDTINTVYFGVRNEYFEKYGGLQQIVAEWYEYKTKEIFVTSDEDAYAELFPYVGVDIGESNDDLDYSVYWEKYSSGGIDFFARLYNDNGRVEGTAANIQNQIDWLFQRNDVKDVSEYGVSSEELLNWMRTYTEKFSKAEKLEVSGQYAKALFEDKIDEDRLSLLEDPSKTCGYVKEEISADDIFKTVNDYSWWDDLWHGSGYKKNEISPIVVLDSTIKMMTVDAFASTYMINDNDKQKVYDDCIAMLNKGEKPILFRFAVTDSYSSTAYFDKHGLFFTAKDGYVAQETVFLDFDVISLTFRDEKSVDTVIPVCASPIDIINGIEAPGDLGTGIGNGAGNALDKFIDLLVAAVLCFALAVIVILVIKLCVWGIKRLVNGKDDDDRQVVIYMNDQKKGT